MANVALSLRVVKPIKDAAGAVKGHVGRIVRKFKEFTVSHLLARFADDGHKLTAVNLQINVFEGRKRPG